MTDQIKQEGSVFTRFYSEELPNRAGVIEQTLSACAEMGLTEHVNDSEPLTPEDATLSEKGYINVNIIAFKTLSIEIKSV